MLNDPLSHGLWEKTAPPAPPTQPLIGDVTADVIVVGCGYTGLAAALNSPRPAPKSLRWSRSRSAMGPPGATSASSTPACG